MDVTILNTNLDAVSIVDTYESFIWTDRYYAYGDFELYEAMREGLLDYIKHLNIQPTIIQRNLTKYYLTQ